MDSIDLNASDMIFMISNYKVFELQHLVDHRAVLYAFIKATQFLPGIRQLTTAHPHYPKVAIPGSHETKRRNRGLHRRKET